MSNIIFRQAPSFVNYQVVTIKKKALQYCLSIEKDSGYFAVNGILPLEAILLSGICDDKF